MGENAITDFFALPELVSELVAQLCAVQPERDVSSLCCVARNWLDPVASRVWSHIDNLKNLSQASSKRQQFYANKVRALFLDDPFQIDQYLADLDVTFPRIEEVGIGSYKDRREYKRHEYIQTPAALWLKKVLGPKIEGLCIWTPILNTNPDVYLAIAEATHLQDLQLWLGDLPSPCSQLIPLVGSLQNLRDIDVNAAQSFKDSKTGERLFQAIARLPLLHGLKIKQEVTEEVIASLEASEAPIFPALETCKVPVRSGLLPRLVSILPSTVTKLNLKIESSCATDESSPVISPLACMTQLEWLKLSLHEDIIVQQTDWLALAKLTALTNLKFVIDEWDRQAMSLDNETFAAIFPKLPALSEIQLNIDHELTAESLAVLGNSCRSLKYMNIQGHFDGDTLFSRPADPPLWPQLSYFTTSKLDFESTFSSSLLEEEFVRTVEKMRPHFLRDVGFTMNEDPYLAHRLSGVFQHGMDPEDVPRDVHFTGRDRWGGAIYEFGPAPVKEGLFGSDDDPDLDEWDNFDEDQTLGW